MDSITMTNTLEALHLTQPGYSLAVGRPPSPLMGQATCKNMVVFQLEDYFSRRFRQIFTPETNKYSTGLFSHVPLPDMCNPISLQRKDHRSLHAPHWNMRQN